MDKSVQVIFSGDVCFNGSFAEKISEAKPVFSEPLSEELQNCDFHVTNFEGIEGFAKSTTESVINQHGSLEYLTKNNVHIFNLANNHMFDHGEKAFENTVDQIKKLKGFSLGAGHSLNEASSVLTLSKNNIKIALLAAGDDSKQFASEKSPGIFNLNHKKILKIRLQEARKNADFVILILHLGEEYTFIPSPKKRRIVHTLLSLHKPDIVICHHSHTFQSIETIKGVPVFFSLGNFVFDWNTHKKYENTDISSLVKFTFGQKKFSYDFIPIKVDRANGQIQKLESSDWENHLQKTKSNHSFLSWMKEAYRVVFQQLPNQAATSHPEGKQRTLSERGFHLLKRSITILMHSSLRQIYFPALLYKVLRNFMR